MMIQRLNLSAVFVKDEMGYDTSPKKKMSSGSGAVSSVQYQT
jgi:hypothetical protein